MIRLNLSYSVYVDTNDPQHPGGAAIDTSDDEAEDGTPIYARLINDDRGWREAAVVEARSSFIVSGLPDHPGASDVLDALKIIMARTVDANVTPQMILSRLLTVDGLGSGLDAALLGGHPPEYYQAASSAGYVVTLISGPETLIPWAELNIFYNAEKTYCILMTPHGNFPDVVSLPYETQSGGLCVRPQRLLEGKLVAGTERKKWGIGKWGEGKVWVPGRKWGEGAWGSGKWDAARFVGGDAWGVYEPMPINIELKEV